MKENIWVTTSKPLFATQCACEMYHPKWQAVLQDNTDVDDFMKPRWMPTSEGDCEDWSDVEFIKTQPGLVVVVVNDITNYGVILELLIKISTLKNTTVIWVHNSRCKYSYTIFDHIKKFSDQIDERNFARTYYIKMSREGHKTMVYRHPDFMDWLNLQLVPYTEEDARFELETSRGRVFDDPIKHVTLKPKRKIDNITTVIGGKIIDNITTVIGGKIINKEEKNVYQTKNHCNNSR